MAVYAACKAFPNRCRLDDDCYIIKLKKGVKHACIAARRTINYVCYKGGDKGHRQAIDEMKNGLKKCDKYYKQLKCDKDKCDEK